MKTNVKDYALAKRLQSDSGLPISGVGFDGDNNLAFGDEDLLNIFSPFLDQAKSQNSACYLLQDAEANATISAATKAGLMQVDSLGATVFDITETVPLGCSVFNIEGVNAGDSYAEVVGFLSDNPQSWNYIGSTFEAS